MARRDRTSKDHGLVPAPKTHAKAPSLRYWRIKKHWTQRQLAQAASVAESTVAHGEQGYALSLLTTGKLADALGVTVRQLRDEEPQDMESEKPS
jgi:transcriptional regulator with XRE-family HTH domain